MCVCEKVHPFPFFFFSSLSTPLLFQFLSLNLSVSISPSFLPSFPHSPSLRLLPLFLPLSLSPYTYLSIYLPINLYFLPSSIRPPPLTPSCLSPFLFPWNAQASKSLEISDSVHRSQGITQCWQLKTRPRKKSIDKSQLR